MFAFNDWHNKLKIESSNPLKAGTYNLRLTVENDAFIVTNTMDFKVIIHDPCNNASFTVGNGILQSLSIDYNLGQAIDYSESLQ